MYWKEDSYDIILIIVACFIKIVDYELIKIYINRASLEEIIINVVIRYYSLSKLIISNQSLLFILKF